MKQHPYRFAGILFVTTSITLSIGCDQQAEQPAKFEPNRVYAYQLGATYEVSMDKAIEQTKAALDDLFGTPDAPKLPDLETLDADVATVVDIELLKTASGAATEEGRGLFRKHCVTCHGATGNGRGATAALLNPYPRDFRLGKFKFKSTSRGSKPLKEDIKQLIRHGIAGTAMVKIPELTEDNISALADYVIYLSWRGEVERLLLYDGSEIDFEGDEGLYEPQRAQSDPEAFAEQIEYIQEHIEDVAFKWLDAEDRVVQIPTRDATVVPDTMEEVLAEMAKADSPVKASVERGHQIFLSDAASCAKCHGKEGRGDGQTNDYDDWTKDWTTNFQLAPDDEEGQISLIARGAMPPRKVSPRDFREGIFRGGSEPENIYRRIAQGIDGTPMPAAALQPEQIWDLVNFVRSMYVPKAPADDSAAEKVL